MAPARSSAVRHPGTEPGGSAAVIGGGWVPMADPAIDQQDVMQQSRSVTAVDRLWHRKRCSVMPMSAAPEGSYYMLLNCDTCLALYTTRATDQEINRANSRLSRVG